MVNSCEEFKMSLLEALRADIKNLIVKHILCAIASDIDIEILKKSSHRFNTEKAAWDIILLRYTGLDNPSIQWDTYTRLYWGSIYDFEGKRELFRFYKKGKLREFQYTRYLDIECILFKQYLKLAEFQDTDKDERVHENTLLYINAPKSPNPNVLERQMLNVPFLGMETTLCNFPIHSKQSNIIQPVFQSTDINSLQSNIVYNFDIQTDNRLVGKILREYIEAVINSYTRSGEFDLITLRLFAYLFVYSSEKPQDLKSDDKSSRIERFKSITDFSQLIFNKQYAFMKAFDEELIKRNFLLHKSSDKSLRMKLVEFYRFLMKEYKEDLYENFDRTFGEVLYSKMFYSAYESGMKFYYYSSYESCPKEDSFYVVFKNMKNRTAHISLTKFDFTDVKLRTHKELLKNFIWSDISTIRRQENYSYVKEFLVSSQEFTDIINVKDKGYLSVEFLIYYRDCIDLRNPTQGGRKGKIKPIRKFLKFAGDKIIEESSCLDIYTLKGLANYDGGRPMTDHDCKKIYSYMMSRQNDSSEEMLYRIVFELMLTTNIRMGNIINLTRDCIISKSASNGKIKLMTKKSDEEFVEKLVSLEVIKLIEDAIKCTEHLVKDDNKNSNLIFIKAYDKRFMTANKLIEFRQYFFRCLKELRSELDFDDYVPYNLRHTFIENAYNEGISKGLTLAEICLITDTSFKTAKKHYRSSNAIKYVEAFANVVLSNVDVTGTISVNPEHYKNDVKNGLGSCKEKHCKFDEGACLRCSYFVTFVNRIPKFQERILSINDLLKLTISDAEKQELIAQKRLLAKYLSKLLSLDSEGDYYVTC